VVVFDNRGVGKSDKPSGPYSMKLMAADVIGLMDHLHIQAANVLGLSMGGMIAQELAINYPHRILKLVLGCTFACQNDGSGQTEEYSKHAGLNPIKTKLALASLANNRPIGRLFVLLWMRLVSRSWVAGFESQGAAIRDHDTCDRLHLIKSPTLVIAGTKDRVIRPSSSGLIASRSLQRVW
jgi:3-oxoadipate enol-lactonase